ncbi:hypothetical protein D4764_15G0010090 [Takifugu flavidus]|uniref:Uncharacterized protein n=1 Tax=Takifugu flavidus TaxID=433684 RepID=A0A5C6P2S3_9TELE|nr:hypothetical protein D4764_15G0010090 [Takifugu flavidus]
MEANSKKHRFRKGRSATFSIDGFNITIGSKSQSALWNAITAGMGIKGKEQKPLLNDPRSLEEILAEDFPLTDEPDTTEKTAISFYSSSKREENDIWNSASNTSHQEKDQKPKTEEERDTDKCAFEENISRLHGTQADLSPPSNTGPISVDESPRLFEVVP